MATRRLTIGFDATPAVQQGAGIGRHARELLRALTTLDPDNQYRVFYASRRRPYPLPPLPHNFHTAGLPLDDIWLARLWHRARVPLPVEAVTGRLDLFHSPDFTLPPTLPGTRTLLTVHDLSFVRDPDSADPGLRAYLNAVVPRCVARADVVLATSQATRQDVIDLYRTPPERVLVLYNGVDSGFGPVTDPAALQAVRAKYQLGQAAFILSVGTLQPRKNHVRLIQAFHRLNPPDVDLVIAGGQGWLYQAIFAEVERLGLQGRVHFPGFVADADLPALYSAARLMAYPSLYEGFGIPVLEAMACGTPVVTSSQSCFPEIAGGAALLVMPTDVDALAHALGRGLQDEALRAELIARGRARPGLFTWEGSARQVLELYTRLAG